MSHLKHKKQPNYHKGYKIAQKPQNKAGGHTAKKRDRPIINKIVAQFASRSRVEIDQWREAIKEAENPRMPRRVKWHNILRDLELDAHLYSQIQIRQLQTVCRQFRIVDKKTRKELPEKTALIKAPWLYQLMKLDIRSVMSGTCVAEIDNVIEGAVTQVYEIPGQHISSDTTEFLAKPTDRSGYNYSDDGYVIEFKEETFMGLINKVAPLLIWKKNAFQAWAEFCEKFGIPMRYATTSKRDKGTIDRIEKMLKSLGSAAQAVFPEGTTITFQDAESKDAFNVFDKLIERVDSQVSKAINSVTMISDNGSSRSQSEVHERMNGTVVKADGMRFQSRMNYDILPKLFLLGFPVNPEIEVFEWDDTESLAKEKQWEIVKGVLDHYDIPDNWITEQFGIPIEGKKINKANTTQAFNYARPAVAMAGLQGMPQYKVCNHGVVNNTSTTTFEKELDKLIKKAFGKALGTIPKDLHLAKGQQLVNQVKEGFDNRLSAIEYNSPDNLRMALYEASVFRFSAASSFKDAINLNKLAKQSKTANEFIKKAEAYKGIVLKHAETEYYQAFSESQNAANWLRQQEDSEEYDLEYQTIGDQMVREEHQALNGLVASIDDNIWNTIYPPNGWQCRCEVVQIPKGTRTQSDTSVVDTSSVKKEFRKNPGKITHIFESTHAYFEEFPEEKTLNRRKYGLKDWTKINRSDMSSISDKISSTAAFKQWWDNETKRLALDNSHIYYKNYLGTFLKLDRARLISKFDTKRYEGQNRHNIATHVEEILQHPDEVWVTQTKVRHSANGTYQATYLKNYKDGTYAVIANGDDELKVTTWYRIDKTEKITLKQNLGDHRNGILLKSNEE